MRPAARHAFEVAGVAAIYFVAAKVGLALAFANSSVTAIWPPTGLALAAVVLLGPRVWPGILVGALLANATTDAPLVSVLGISFGNTLEALAGAWLLRRAGFRATLERVVDVLALVLLAGGLSTLVAATIGLLSLKLGGAVAAGTDFETWRVWWLGDLGGDLLVAPAVFVLAGVRRWNLHERLGHLLAPAAVLAGCAALVVVSAVVFRSDTSLAYAIFPLLFVIALCLRQPGAVLAGLVVSGIAIYYAARGQGPFIGGSPDAALLRAQTFVGVATITALMIAAARTERNDAEAALAKAEESGRALAESQRLAHIGSWEWDMAADRVWWSDELFRIYGVDRATFEASFDGYMAHVHPDDREHVALDVQRTLELRGNFEREYRVIRADGAVRTLQSRGEVVVDDDGRPIKMFGTCQDVTDFRVAQERFRALLESAPDAIVIADERGEIVLVNSQVERLFGYAREELVGQQVEVLVPARLRRDHAGHRHEYLGDLHARPMGSGLDLYACRKDGSEFPVEISLSPLATDQGTLISSAIRDVTDRKREADAMAHRALHDGLTGLPNRVLLLDRLEHALARAQRSGNSLAVLFCDVDDFKRINDSLGHEAGDDLLLALTPRLCEAVRPGDTVARFGGDEFVILCEDLAPGAAPDIAHRIAEVSKAPFVLDGREHFVSLSVGVVVADGRASSPAELLRDADAAMYQAKLAGKNAYEIFSADTRTQAVRRLEIETELRRALADGQFRLHYQPVVDLRNGRMVAAEALLRWEHPQRGLLAPADFLRVIEDMGLILPVGEWVIHEACRQAVAFQSDPRTAGLRVAVNLSPRQVVRGDTAAIIDAALAATGLDPSLLDVELTETSLIEDSQLSDGALHELHKRGIRLVLDDFGTGFSSMDRLRRLPVDTIKIDGSFVAGIGNATKDTAIVDGILDIARTLDIAVVAEGVETVAQAQHLAARGCDYAQGHLFAPASTPDALRAYAPAPARARAPS